MYFLLLDPIFWINKTLATFDRMVSRLHKYIDKCEAELSTNREAILIKRDATEAKIQTKMEKKEAKLARIKAKADNKMEKIANTAANQVNAINARNEALMNAKQRAETTAKNIQKLTGDK